MMSAPRTPESRRPDRVSQPKVSHQVVTNAVTQVERTPVTLQESDPAAPPLTSVGGGRSRPSKLSPRTRCSRLGPPHLPDGSSAGAAFACYSRLSTSVKTAGPPLILQGYIPAAAPGGAWPNFRTSASLLLLPRLGGGGRRPEGVSDGIEAYDPLRPLRGPLAA